MDREQFENRKKMLHAFICDELYVPMKIKEIAIMLRVAKEQRSELQEVLNALVEEGKVEVTAKGKYTKLTERSAKANGKYLVGTYTANSRGFGFVTIDEDKDGAIHPAEKEEDLFISEENHKGAMHLDKVEVEILPKQSGKRREGRIVKILSHGVNQVIGTYQASSNFGFVMPDNQKLLQDIFIPLERSKDAVTGHKVVVELTNYGTNGKKPEGKVVEIIGHINDPGTDIMSIVRGYDLPVEFSEKIMRQVANVAKDVSEADMAGRMDIRDWQMVTIDGEEAKDLDDAVSLTMEGENYRLGVHIADVTNYVQEHSALDAEALDRGTSVYLVDRVIPMLPHKLSNGICSLNAGVPRLALSCIMTIDKKGKVIDHKIAETVIQVDRRMTYTAVKEIIEERETAEQPCMSVAEEKDSARISSAEAEGCAPQISAAEEYKELVPMFERMRDLAAILRKKRMSRGSIDFDFPETKIILNEQGKPIDIKPYDRNVATKIIEEFMLIANETVAQDYFWQELPFVYRTHENPDEEKIQKLSTFINNFGYTLHIGQDEMHPKELQKLLMKIEGSEEEALISRLTLRSMKQARYTTENTGHFGLATSYYCHFTSPIRRYPDLQIHRIIKENLRGRLNAKRIEHYADILPEVAKHSSEMERRADEAERETDKLKKVEYMEQHLGEVFDGVISSVTNWGLYVELPNTIEGLIHVTALMDDYYHYQEDTYELIGEATNKHYKLGQKVQVVAVGVDKMTRTIDFVLADEYPQIDDGQDADSVAE